ncbi:sigma 54-interacting transcriptional regulator [Bacillus massiliigorillae]|uniref:sigma 54-interacting transcriptional regulator n=1 Tax=Bacillus massiliigorillae TaxID=1243664 RepID=UPI0003A1E2DA|nr:sigma 54-interacting transcriptional regulator [Bacillus massiliigorillae]
MRWKWQDVLKPLPIAITKQTRVHEAVSIFTEKQLTIGFVFDEDELVGYLDLESLLKQVANNSLLNLIEFNNQFVYVRERGWGEFYHNCSMVVGVDENHKVTSYITIAEAREIIAQIQLEQLNHSIDSAQMGVITTNELLEINFMNETAEAILGLSRSVLLGRNYKKILKSELDISQVLAGEQIFGVASSFNYKEITGQLSPIYQDDTINGIVHVFYLQKQVDEAISELQVIRHQNEEFHAIYQASNEQIIVVDSFGKIIRLAGAFFENFWGDYSKEMLIGQNVNDIVALEQIKPNIVEMCMKEQQKISMTQVSKNNVKIWSTATPIFKDHILEKVVVLSRDVTTDISVNRIIGDIIEDSAADKKLVYRSKTMTDLVEEMKEVATVHSRVLITGESGVGKEVIARHIHHYSSRSAEPFVTVNCGAIPENLLESELFGYEKGAFTSAVDRKKGLFEVANGGTIFLDEITEMPMHMQVKLLRVLQEHEIVRVGGITPIKVDVRIVAATNRNMKKMIQSNQFREDLYYRLHVIPLHIPPLRKRKEDVVALALHFLEVFNETYRKEKHISREGLEILENYYWPGNIRELQNVMERLVVTERTEWITEKRVFQILYESDMEEQSQLIVQEIMPLKEAVEEVEKQLIELAVMKYGTAAKASEVLGVSASTISRRMNKVRK